MFSPLDLCFHISRICEYISCSRRASSPFIIYGFLVTDNKFYIPIPSHLHSIPMGMTQLQFQYCI